MLSSKSCSYPEVGLGDLRQSGDNRRLSVEGIFVPLGCVVEVSTGQGSWGHRSQGLEDGMMPESRLPRFLGQEEMGSFSSGPFLAMGGSQTCLKCGVLPGRS